MLDEEFFKIALEEIKPKEYNKRIKLILEPNGYYVFFDKAHPLSYKDGKTYYHRHMMAIKLERWVLSEENVHHIDDNKLNNNINNLEILSRKEHSDLHNPRLKSNIICKICKVEFYPSTSKTSKFCSDSCFKKSIQKFNPTKQELRQLVWLMPTTKVAKLFGVSDVAVSKRCKKLGINKPPRGYWS